LRKLIDRIRREPVVARGLLAAVLNVLVVSGVLDASEATVVSETVEAIVATVVLVVGNVTLLLGARKRVTPTS
jgi:hypothetical protein